MVKQELMNPEPSLLDFIIQEKLYLPRLKFVGIDDYAVSDIMNYIARQQDAVKTDQMVMYYANRKHNSDRCVNVSLKSTITDHDVVASVYGPIAELKELLEHNWLKKRQTGYIDLMFTSFCNPDSIDSHQEVITELKEFSKKHSGLEI